MRPAAALRRMLARLVRRRGEQPPPTRDNPYGRYFTADPTPDQIARRLRRDGPDKPR